MKRAPAITPRQTISGGSSLRGIVHLPDKQQVITFSAQGLLRQWDLKNGVAGKDWPEYERYIPPLNIIALSPNGKKIVGGSEDGVVRMWDVESKKVVARWMGHTDYVRAICWSPDGQRVLSGSDDHTAIVRDVERGEPVLSPIMTGHNVVHVVTYSPDGRNIGTGGSSVRGGDSHTNYIDGIRIWDGKTGDLVATLEQAAVYGLVWTSDGKRIVSGSQDSSIRIFDTATWEEISTIKFRRTSIDSFSVSADGSRIDNIFLSKNDRILVTLTPDRFARLWDIDTNLRVGPPLPHDSSLDCAGFSPDGKLLITGSNGKIYVWDVDDILKEAGLEDLLDSFLDADATRRPARLPEGFLADMRDSVHSTSVTHLHTYASRHRDPPTPPSGSHPLAPLRRLSSLFRSSESSHPSNNDAVRQTKKQHSRQSSFFPRRSSTLVIAAARDKGTLYVAPSRITTQEQPQPQSQGQNQPRAATQDRLLYVAPPHHKRRKSENAQTPGQEQVQSESHLRPRDMDMVTAAKFMPSTTTDADPTTDAPSHLAVVNNPVWWIRVAESICCSSVSRRS